LPAEPIPMMDAHNRVGLAFVFASLLLYVAAAAL
jgi:hypothetical protein